MSASCREVEKLHCKLSRWIAGNISFANAGLVYNLTEYLSSHGVNIESLETYRQEVWRLSLE